MDIETNNLEKCTIALSGLKSVIDPEIGLNVVDLGLIYQVDFEEEEKNVQLVMTLTTQFCPMGEAIQSDVTDSLTTSFPGYNIKLELTFDPAWKMEMISEEGRQFLNH
ncbi:MAG: metal-sulfur cluster assembly factor [Bacteroidetes bacterium]|nr:metal-sulfur cluster assembly factor [Bacteroidota bacterium]